MRVNIPSAIDFASCKTSGKALTDERVTRLGNLCDQKEFAGGMYEIVARGVVFNHAKESWDLWLEYRKI